MVGAMDVQSTSWNHQLSADQIGIHLKESTVYTCPLENYDFECILAEMDKISESFRNAPKLGEVPSSVKYTLVMGNEYGNRKLYSHVPRPNETTHIDLSKTMNNRATPEAMQRLRRINTRFTQNITVILSLIKAFSLCQ